MKICFVNQSDTGGGAAKASMRLARALRDAGMNITMMVDYKRTEEDFVISPDRMLQRHRRYARIRASKFLLDTLKMNRRAFHSPSLFPSRWPDLINRLQADIVHLHWVQYEMLSVEDICRIEKPLIWTLHDMWAFCGSEHYARDERWASGYSRSNRPDTESVFDLNRHIWRRKARSWTTPFQIITPSQWLEGCVSKSALMENWPVRTIPNTIDTNIWSPRDKVRARKRLGIPVEGELLLFGAIGGTKDPRKGFDLLIPSLAKLKQKRPRVKLVVFGGTKPPSDVRLPIPICDLGYIDENEKLVDAYSASDVVIIPSRQDNLPNMGLEALACGRPVVAFDIGGLPDIIDHRETGYLATPFDHDELTDGLDWILSDQDRLRWLEYNARTRALSQFSPSAIVPQYISAYEALLKTG